MPRPAARPESPFRTVAERPASVELDAPPPASPPRARRTTVSLVDPLWAGVTCAIGFIAASIGAQLVWAMIVTGAHGRVPPVFQFVGVGMATLVSFLALRRPTDVRIGPYGVLLCHALFKWSRIPWRAVRGLEDSIWPNPDGREGRYYTIDFTERRRWVTFRGDSRTRAKYCWARAAYETRNAVGASET